LKSAPKSTLKAALKSTTELKAALKSATAQLKPATTELQATEIEAALQLIAEHGRRPTFSRIAVLIARCVVPRRDVRVGLSARLSGLSCLSE
jgi:hypothetical protein